MATRRHNVKIKPLHPVRKEDDHYEVVCETCLNDSSLPDFRIPVNNDKFAEAIRDRHIRNMENKESS